MLRTSHRWLLLGVMLLAGVVAAACGSADGQTGGSGANGSGASGTGNSGTGAEGGLGIGGGASSSGTGGLDECAGESHLGKQDPLDLVIMLDKSGSMAGTVNNVTLWQLVTDALNSFVTAPDSAALGVGLQLFPIPDGPCGACDSSCTSLMCVNYCCGTPTGAACTGQNTVCPTGGLCANGQCYTSGGLGTCDAGDYASLAVPIATLPGNAGAISSALAGSSPDGLTPTGPALQGAIQAATSWAGAHPDHIVAVVLATDGVPTECSPQDIGQIANLAAAAAGGSPEILTFVIGIGDLTALNAIAAAGGTQQAFIVNPNASTTQQLIDALNAIRGELLSCEFDIPEPQEGEIDFTLVNVRVTPAGQDPIIIPQVADEQACDPTVGGWYYNDPVAPTKIVTCPVTCDMLKSYNDATLEIVLGCKTIIL